MSRRPAACQRSATVRLLVLFTATPWLFLVPLQSPTLLLASLQNAGHTLVFALLGFTWLQWRWQHPARRRLASQWRDILIVTTVLFCAGVAVEIAQTLLERTASLLDIALNSAGLIAGVTFHLARRRGPIQCVHCAHELLTRSCLVLLGCLAVLISLFRPLQYVAIELLVDHPNIVSDFESGLDHLTTESIDGAQIEFVDSPAFWSLNPGRVMQVNFPPATYPGFAMMEPRGDWTLGEQFTFDVFNPEGDTIALSLRINDATHDNTFEDRFNTVLYVEPGSNHFAIPLADVQNPQGVGPGRRKLDLSNITGLIGFVVDNARHRRLYFDNLRLVRAPGVRVDMTSPQSPPPPLAMNPIK